MDALSVMSPEDMADAIRTLKEDERVYLRQLVSHMVRSFTDSAYSCVLVLGMHDTRSVVVCSVRANEDQAADILAHACGVMGFKDSMGVPARGEFH